MKLSDARIVLTGAAGGIGAAAAQALAARGAQLLLVGRRADSLEALAARLGAAAGPVQTLAVDLTDAGAVDTLRRRAERWNANVLVNNAGIASFGRLDGLTPQHIESVLLTDLVAPVLLTRALLPHLLAQPRAIVLNVGSVLGRLGLPGHSVYSAAKFGLRGFSESLRRELAGGPVKVLHLAPRATRTAFNDARVQAHHRATATGSDTAEQVAAALLVQIEHERPERTLGFPERLAVRLNGALPGWLDGAFRRHREHLPAGQPPVATPVNVRQPEVLP